MVSDSALSLEILKIHGVGRRPRQNRSGGGALTAPSLNTPLRLVPLIETV